MNELSSLLGLHIGDSFGSSLEFERPNDRENFQLDIVGGGRLGYRIGSPTDDTLMMIMLFESLLFDPCLDIFELSSRFVDWWMSEPLDIGRTTYFAIQNMIDGKPPSKWGLGGGLDQGNGSLMRCLPLALFDVDKDTIYKQTAMTHNSESCKLSDFIFISAVKDAYLGKNKYEILKNALSLIPEGNIKLKALLESINVMKWDDLKTSGYVYHTLVAAFWGLINTTTFEDAIVMIANRGDDSDTCAAVTGALCGAYYGLGGLPTRWRSIIQEGDRITRLFRVWERQYSIK